MFLYENRGCWVFFPDTGRRILQYCSQCAHRKSDIRATDSQGEMAEEENSLENKGMDLLRVVSVTTRSVASYDLLIEKNNCVIISLSKESKPRLRL